MSSMTKFSKDLTTGVSGDGTEPDDDDDDDGDDDEEQDQPTQED